MWKEALELAKKNQLNKIQYVLFKFTDMKKQNQKVYEYSFSDGSWLLLSYREGRLDWYDHRTNNY